MPLETVRERWDATLPYVVDWISHRAAAHRIPGMQLAVRYGSSLRLSAAMGVTREDLADAVTSDHLFRIGSQTKTITATAVHQLVEAGVIRLDDTLDLHIVELQNTKAGAVTVDVVLSHSSGLICDGSGTDRGQLLAPSPSELEIIRTAIVEGCVLEPLVATKYSNLGYNLLGILIARVTGRSYDDYVRRNVLGPLNLLNTGMNLDAARSPEFVHGHSGGHIGDQRRVFPLVDSAGTVPCGGAYSTAEDLAEYLSAHLYGDSRLLSDTSKRRMQHPTWPAGFVSAEGSCYTPGMASRSIRNRRYLGQVGGHPGGQASFSVLEQDRGLIVTLLTNAIDAPVEAMVGGVIDILDLAASDPSDGNGPGVVPGVVRPGALRELDPEEMAPFVGRFVTEWGVSDIAAVGGRLMLIGHRLGAAPFAAASRLVPVSSNELMIVGNGSGLLGERLHFVGPPNGSGIERVKGRGGMTMWPIGRASEILTTSVTN